MMIGTTRRAILAGVPTAIAAATLPVGAVTNIAAIAEAKAAAEPDPIFALIEAHKAAASAYPRVSDIYASMLSSDPGYEVASEQDQEASRQEALAVRDLMLCQPTTLAGILALLDHVGQPELLIYGDEGTGETVLTGGHVFHRKEAQKFPLKIAAALRSLTEAAQS
jgi:hypothetical protein